MWTIFRKIALFWDIGCFYLDLRPQKDFIGIITKAEKSGDI